METLIKAFGKINSSKAIDEFVETYELKQRDRALAGVPNLLGYYTGMVKGMPVELIHRWHDPSQAFSIQRDINKLSLMIDGRVNATTEFPDK